MVPTLWVLQLSNPVMIKRRRETNAVLDKVKDWNITFFCRVTIFISTALHIAAESNLKDPHCHLLKKPPPQGAQHANNTKHLLILHQTLRSLIWWMDQKRQNIAWNTSGQQIKLLQLRNTDQIAIIISIRREKQNLKSSMHRTDKETNKEGKESPSTITRERGKGRLRVHYSSWREQIFIRDLNIGNQRP